MFRVVLKLIIMITGGKVVIGLISLNIMFICWLLGVEISRSLNSYSDVRCE